MDRAGYGSRNMNRLRNLFEKVRPRMTPSIVVIGAQKAGTTALFSILAAHPKAARPKEKELHFFSDDAEYAKGMERYREMFPAIPARSFGHFTFEASPGYLIHAGRSAPRIAEHLPNAICVAILRDPVLRAFSAWNMFRDFKGDSRWGHLHDPRSFAQAVEDELAGRTNEPAHLYLARGRYADQIAAYQEHLGPGRLRVYGYPLFKQDPAGVVADICQAIGQEALPKEHRAFALRSNKRTYVNRLDPGLADELQRYFAPELKKLAHVLGRELDLSE